VALFEALIVLELAPQRFRGYAAVDSIKVFVVRRTEVLRNNHTLALTFYAQTLIGN
jgi:hypothetical protein